MLYLYRAGYDFKRLFTLSEYYDRDRTLFYRAIRSVRERGMDMTGWLEFFLQGLSTQLTEVSDRGKRLIRRDAIAREYNLNPRQVAAVGCLLEQHEMRIEDLERLCPKVTRRTLQRDLQGLVERRVAKAAGAARSARYLLKIKGL